MKKYMYFLLFLISFGFFFTLTSCDNNQDELVGVWMVLEPIKADETKKYNSVSELEKEREALGVEYYVDGYSSDEVKGYLNEANGWYFLVTYTIETTEFYCEIDVYYANGSYYLHNNNAIIPSMTDINPLPYFETSYKIKDETILFRYQYKKDSDKTTTTTK